MCTQITLLVPKSNDSSNQSIMEEQQNQSSSAATKRRASIVRPLIMSADNVVKEEEVEVETYKNHNHNQKKKQRTMLRVIPDDSDVLGGRGNGVGSHPGNIHYRNLLKQYQIKYLHAAPGKKRTIVTTVIETVQLNGGRFLKPVETNDDLSGVGWECMTMEESRRKTAQALRDGSPMTLKNQLKSCKKQQKHQQQLKSKGRKQQFKQQQDHTTHCFTPSNITTTTTTTTRPSEVCDDDAATPTRPTSKMMSLQDEINGEMLNSFKKKMNRIKGDMNELKRKYDQLDKEQHELTREFMKKIVADNSTDIL